MRDKIADLICNNTVNVSKWEASSLADEIMELFHQGPTVTGDLCHSGVFHKGADNQRTYALVLLPEEDE